MKKFFKKSILTLVAILTLGATGCNLFNKQETYSAHGMSITMDAGFQEKNLLSATYYLEKDDAIMIATKEEFQTLLPSTMTLESYTKLVLQNNLLNRIINTRENKDYLYFDYTKTVSGNSFYYIATTHKTDDSFWLIQFCCDKDNKDEFLGKFLEWADTITFATTEE